MANNFAAFEASLEKAFEEKVVQRFVQKHKAITMRALQEAGADSREVSFEHGSPVWTGRFRASHQLGVGEPATPAPAPQHPEVGEGLRWPTEPDSPYRANSLAGYAAALLQLKPFDKTFVSNALPYAQKLEKGYSPKAPEGIYGIIASRLFRRYANTKL
jgi:hypothetical protein